MMVYIRNIPFRVFIGNDIKIKKNGSAEDSRVTKRTESDAESDPGKRR